MYIYILYHVAFGHFIPSTVLFSFQISKYYWFVFVRRCFLSLVLKFSIYFFFLNLALTLSSFCSLLCSFTALPPHFRVKVLWFAKHNSQRVQRTKLDSESFVNVYQFIRYLSVVFKKNSSVKDLIYPFCLSKFYGRNILIQSNLLKTVIIPKR